MANDNAVLADIQFDAPNLFAQLDELRDNPGRYDALNFGLVAMDIEGTVTAYNRPEADFAGIEPDRAIGLVFFTDVAPCTNNYLVAGRFDEEETLDETIGYVFTIKMRPTPVRLRLLKSESEGRQYLVVKF